MKTVSQWLTEYLPQNVAEKAIQISQQQHGEFRLNLPAKNPMKAISMAFTWSDETVHGYDYWKAQRDAIYARWILEHKRKSVLSSDLLIDKYYPDKEDGVFEMYVELGKLVRKEVDPGDMGNILEVYEGLDDPKIQIDYNETLIKVLRRTLEEVSIYLNH